MTTDNRTNEPTEEQIERAAQEFERVWDENIDTFDPEHHDAMSYIKTAMRAALTAANAGAGVAPQEQEEAGDVVVFACGQMIPVSEFGVEEPAPQGPRQNETKSGQDFVSLDAEKVAAFLTHRSDTPGHRGRKLGLARALCEAYKEGKLT